MVNENIKENIGDLGDSWGEKLNDIRSMAKESQGSDDDTPQEGPPAENSPALDESLNVPADNELFATPVYEELTPEQVFVGDDNFFKTLNKSQPRKPTKPSAIQQIISVPNEYNGFSTTQKALVAAIILIAVTLLYVKTKSPSESFAGLAGDETEEIAAIDQRIADINPSVARTIDVEPEMSEELALTGEATEPSSLQIAQKFYLDGNYEEAWVVYEQLHDRLSVNPREKLMKDSLQLQMALCMERIGDYEGANLLLRKIVKSDSPAVRVVANYHRGLLEMQKKQYLSARTKAFQAIALVDTIDVEEKWALTLKTNCYYLAGEAMTKKILSLCDADKDLPKYLWNDFGAGDEPFIHLDESELRSFLKSGRQHLSRAILGPQIRQFDRQDGMIRYGFTSNGSSIEEVLTRFSANAEIDLNWDLGEDEIGIRKQLTYLHFSAATPWQLVTAAAGSSGLMARHDENGAINISDPALYSNVSDHISALNEEAVSLWQQFLLRFPKDLRVANIHFALGLLYEQNKMPIESIGEFKLMANRFARSPLVPYALLNSSKLKSSLRNYSGGSDDLRQIVEQYPDTEISEEAYLRLAEATAKSGLKVEALRLYRKTYNVSLSAESKSTAALGAGSCSYSINDFTSAATWLTRHIKLLSDNNSTESYLAYFLLGKSYKALNNSEAASKALKYALQGGSLQLGREKYIDAISSLVDIYMKQDDFVKALDMLEGIDSIALSQEESINALLLKSKALRAMGLVDKAISMLNDQSRYINDIQLKMKIEFETGKCYAEKGELDLAKETLVGILALAEPGPLLHRIALKLGEVCLQLGENSQTIAVCNQLLDLDPSEQIKQEAFAMLSKAHNQQKNYNRAALALMGQWK